MIKWTCEFHMTIDEKILSYETEIYFYLLGIDMVLYLL